MLLPFRSRLWFAFLLGAGALAALLLPATAGDKIIYSSSSDTLSVPAVEQPENEQTKLSSTPLGSLEPVTEMGYYEPPSYAVAPLPRKDHDLLKPEADQLGKDRFDRASENAGGTDDPNAPKPAGKQVWSVEKGFVTESSANPLLGVDGSRSKFGSAAYHSDPFNLGSKQDGQNNSGFGSSKEKTGARRSDNPYSSTSSDSQNDSLMESISRYQHAYSYSSLDSDGSRYLYGPSAESSSSSPAPSLFSSEQSISPVTPSHSQSSLLGADLLSGKAASKDDGHFDLAPDQHAWSEPSAVTQPSQQYHKPYVPPPQEHGASQSQHPANLAWPKQPGSVF